MASRSVFEVFKKSKNNITLKKKISSKNMLLFGVVFALIGVAVLVAGFAATTSQLVYENNFSTESDMNRLYKVIHDGGGNFSSYNEAHTFHGDHDLSCGSPATTRLIDTNGAQDQYSTYRIEDLFWYCAPGSETTKGHFMTGLDTGNYVSIAFSPMNASGNGPLLVDNPIEVCWDMNVTDLSHRKWNELIITPESVIQALGTNPNIGRFANPNFIANAGPDGVLPYNGTFLFSNIKGNTQFFKNDSETFNDLSSDYYSEITAAISGIADKATRYKTCIKDNRNGTVTRTQAVPGGRTVSVTGNGSFPTGKAAVIFKDVSYNVMKAYSNEGATQVVTDPFTWHWDNLQVYNSTDSITPPSPIDTAKPAVTLTVPSNGASFSAGNITLTASATDNVGVSSVDFYIDGTLKGQGLLGSTAGIYSLPITVASLTNGTHTVYAVAKDAAGNTQQSANTSITVSAPSDTTKPSVTLTSPSNSASFTAGTGTITFSATASDNIAVSSVDFYVDNTLLANGTTTGNGTYTLTQSTANLAVAAHTIYAVAKDAAGNTQQSSTVNITILQAADTTAPSISLTAPAANTTVSGTITVSSDATDNIGVASVSYFIDGSSTAFSIDTTQPYNSSWNSALATNGNHTIMAKATDTSGNLGQTAAVTFTVNNTVADTTKPTVKITDPLNGATVSGTKTITVSASDNIGISKVELLIDGVLKAVDTTSPYSFSWSTTSYGDGTHTLEARAIDAANNSSTSTALSVTVKNTTTTPSTTPKQGDVNLDGRVNRTDSRIVRRNMGKSPATRDEGDLNGDNIVNILDLAIVYANWGR